MKDNKKLRAAVGKFSASIRTYILLEYRGVYNDIYSNIKVNREYCSLYRWTSGRLC